MNEEIEHLGNRPLCTSRGKHLTINVHVIKLYRVVPPYVSHLTITVKSGTQERKHEDNMHTSSGNWSTVSYTRAAKTETKVEKRLMRLVGYARRSHTKTIGEIL